MRMFAVSMDSGSRMKALAEVVARLRSPQGCPWDQAQTAQSMKPYLIEEAFEVLEAMDGPPDQWREELGDLLFQIVFHARLAEEQGLFDLAGVASGIHDKMVRRHPHVFGDSTATSAEGVVQSWEQQKREERRKTQQRASVLDGIPSAQPALLEAWRMTEKASRVGFDWPDVSGVQEKLAEELGELQEAMREGSQAAIEHELGDVLFSVVNLARFLGVNPEDALKKTNRRFKARFHRIEDALLAQGKRPEEVHMEQLEQLWQEAKRLEQGK